MYYGYFDRQSNLLDRYLESNCLDSNLIDSTHH